MVGPAELFAACADYVTAMCRRRDHCSKGLYDWCFANNMGQCRSFVAVADPRATLEGVEQCIGSWQRASCLDVQSFRFPTCAFDPGQRKLGQRCFLAGQCESGACSKGASGCGRCVPIVSKGQTCGVELAGCEPNMVCIPTCADGSECPNRCGDDLIPQGVLGVGEACQGSAQCQRGLACTGESAGELTCQPGSSLGEPCFVTIDCLEGYCHADSRVCTAAPSAGLPCASDGINPTRFCGPDSRCDAHEDPSVCVTPAALGEPCWLQPMDVSFTQATCQPGLACVCSDPSCTTGGGQCHRVLGPGERCDFAGAWCAGTECRNGRCEPVLAPPPAVEACAP